MLNVYIVFIAIFTLKYVNFSVRKFTRVEINSSLEICIVIYIM